MLTCKTITSSVVSIPETVERPSSRASRACLRDANAEEHDSELLDSVSAVVLSEIWRPGTNNTLPYPDENQAESAGNEHDMRTVSPLCRRNERPTELKRVLTVSMPKIAKITKDTKVSRLFLTAVDVSDMQETASCTDASRCPVSPAASVTSPPLPKHPSPSYHQGRTATRVLPQHLYLQRSRFPVLPNLPPKQAPPSSLLNLPDRPISTARI
jgi:hypothetical protein